MKIFIKHMNQEFDLTDEQTRLVDKAVDQITHGSMLFQYAAPAGCGKSIVLHAIIQELGLLNDEVAPMAYMGSAAMVMRKHGFTNAKTCHAWLFAPVTSPVPGEYDEHFRQVYETKWEPKQLPYDIKLIAIDEGSMIPQSIRNVIDAQDIPVIVCGDLDQLPPVGDYSAYLVNGEINRLTKIMRQRANSSIVTISNMLREGYRPQPGNYGEVLVIPFEEVTNDMLVNSESIICGYNSTRSDLTDYMRKLLGYSGNLPYPGEKVVCRENNWKVFAGEDINLVNGMIGTCESQGNSVNQMKNSKTFKMDFRPLLFPDAVFTDLKCDYNYFVANHEQRQEIKRMERFKQKRYDKANKFEFGYVITTHMSQGNQYRNGMYIEQKFPTDQNKLNYTGITRFIDHCVYVLPRKRKLTFPPPGRVIQRKKPVMIINDQYL